MVKRPLEDLAVGAKKSPSGLAPEGQIQILKSEPSRRALSDDDECDYGYGGSGEGSERSRTGVVHEDAGTKPKLRAAVKSVKALLSGCPIFTRM